MVFGFRGFRLFGIGLDKLVDEGYFVDADGTVGISSLAISTRRSSRKQVRPPIAYVYLDRVHILINRCPSSFFLQIICIV